MNKPRRDLIAHAVESMRPFLRRWSEVEHAPRWVFPECQFEQNEHYASHERGCSSYRREAL